MTAHLPSSVRCPQLSAVTAHAAVQTSSRNLLVTQTFALSDINRAFEAMEAGSVARSVIAYA